MGHRLSVRRWPCAPRLPLYRFTAPNYDGEPEETAEAIPIWASTEAMPYDEMWADDRLWMPLLFDGQTVRGRAVFDGDTLLDWGQI
jgi:8-oxo-dGTP diphosphatase